jgi:hypothetical protein
VRQADSLSGCRHVSVIGEFGSAREKALAQEDTSREHESARETELVQNTEQRDQSKGETLAAVAPGAGYLAELEVNEHAHASDAEDNADRHGSDHKARVDFDLQIQKRSQQSSARRHEEVHTQPLPCTKQEGLPSR